MEWQPIETAPRDGSRILLYSPTYKEQFVAFWAICIDDYSARFIFAKGEGLIFTINNATHWMPLPPPPKEGEE